MKSCFYIRLPIRRGAYVEAFSLLFTTIVPFLPFPSMYPLATSSSKAMTIVLRFTPNVCAKSLWEGNLVPIVHSPLTIFLLYTFLFVYTKESLETYSVSKRIFPSYHLTFFLVGDLPNHMDGYKFSFLLYNIHYHNEFK